jgi:hypothetical protein
VCWRDSQTHGEGLSSPLLSSQVSPAISDFSVPSSPFIPCSDLLNGHFLLANYAGGVFFKYEGCFRRWISIWWHVPGSVLIWRRISEVAFSTEADSGRIFTYGGRFWRRLFYQAYKKGMSGTFCFILRRMSLARLYMEAVFRGNLQSRGGFGGGLEADFNMEAYFFLTGTDFVRT